MFVYNFKFNAKKIVKILFILVSLLVTIYFIVSTYKIYNNSFKIKNDIQDPDIINLTADNYTNVLKCVHDDLNTYVGKKICFTGYVYRLSDFKDNEFVLARDMIISSDIQTLVVGFLCSCNNIKEYENGSWVEITGKISKGNYHGDIPVIKVQKIKEIEKPNENIYVYPPDDSFVPTSSIF